MKTVHITIWQIGNSQGFVVPKPLLAQLGLKGGADLTIERDALVLRKSARKSRDGWAEAAKKIAPRGDDELVLGDFLNEADTEWKW
jgi:antitoxin MazE